MEFKSLIATTMAGKAILGMAAAAAMSFSVSTTADAATLVAIDPPFTVNETGPFNSRTFMGSPAIAKFDWKVGDTGDVDVTTLWPVSEDDFSVMFSDFDKSDPNDDPKTVTFSFDLSSILFDPSGDETLGIRYITLKTGLTDQAWRFVDEFGETTAVSVFSGSLTVTGQAISHITFWDTGVPPGVIPLPAAGWLLLTGMGGLALLRRRKTA
jgi:hypothetical protein